MARRILCADDEPELLNTLQILFRSAGYEILTAANGEEAVAKFREHKDTLDAVVLDLRMPGKDGISAAREIRSESEHIPIVALSAYIEGEASVHKCMEAGFSAYTKKPFASDLFLKHLDDLIQNYHRIKR